MTSKEKKEYIVLGILLAGIAGVLGFYFLKSGPTGPGSVTPPPAGSAGVLAPGTPVSSGSAPVSAPGSAGSAVSSGSSQGFLPNGASFDTAIFNDPRFKALITPQYPVVTPDQVGQGNPFLNTLQ